MSRSEFPDFEAEALLSRRVRLAQLEADMAYFHARLEHLGRPISANQLAQRKVFRLLAQTTGDRIVRARERMLEEHRSRRKDESRSGPHSEVHSKRSR